MKPGLLTLSVTALLLALAAPARATVFLNEVLINPPGSGDDREFIELCGTPNRRLDGYAVAFVKGSQEHLFPLGSIPPAPIPAPEIDEFFSLDGLSLGKNGLLVIGFTLPAGYSTLLADANFRRWVGAYPTGIWNGLLDVPSNLDNDGSTTIFLVRRRPGVTEADPLNPLGLRWGKDIPCDDVLVTPVIDPQDGLPKDQFGDGTLDKGEPRIYAAGDTLDLKGASTSQPGEDGDDLEIVDELSFEHDRGWEYDVDNRRADDGSTVFDLPGRRVHTLDDPSGFNPDGLTRVDYRTRGPGWAPAAGGTGELPSGNNWQDTATEQWIRGEVVSGASGQGAAPFYFFSNVANIDPNALQPYETHVPLWLNDGSGADFNFLVANSYQVMAGRMNPLATPFIPGDVDRDGNADASDIARLAAVFGDADWIFSNSYAGSPQGDSGDPATQTRPWDVDCTGDNGIECSDLQWTLNFQGDATGHIVGVRYDSTTPAASGVVLNPAASVGVTLTTAVVIPSGRPITGLAVNDLVQVTLRAALSSGAIVSAGAENGVMQFIHDLTLSGAGVLKVVSVAPAAPFFKTRVTLESLLGVQGDLGMRRINGYTTSFNRGLSAPADLYVATLQAVGLGSATIQFAPAADGRFAASTPRGLKVGHTDQNGNPASAAYPASLAATVSLPAVVVGDIDADGDVDETDRQLFVRVLLHLDLDPGHVSRSDINSDGAANGRDVQPFLDALFP
ncbi:MAG: hypothetical protein U1A27_07780 [Phycisphaerae bacterium]